MRPPFFPPAPPRPPSGCRASRTCAQRNDTACQSPSTRLTRFLCALLVSAKLGVQLRKRFVVSGRPAEGMGRGTHASQRLVLVGLRLLDAILVGLFVLRSRVGQGRSRRGTARRRRTWLWLRTHQRRHHPAKEREGSLGMVLGLGHGLPRKLSAPCPLRPRALLHRVARPCSASRVALDRPGS